MKLWALLEALQPLDPGAEVSIGLRDASTEDFEVQGVPAGHSVTLSINPDTLALPADPRMEDLEESLDEKRTNLNHLVSKACILLRNLKEPREGLTAADRTVLLNTAIGDLEDIIEDITT